VPVPDDAREARGSEGGLGHARPAGGARVEKKLGISGKPQIEEYGVARFNAQCRESVWTYKKEWEELSERTGYWLDYSHPYVTYENEYIESVWNLLALFHEKGLVYRGKTRAPVLRTLRHRTLLARARATGRLPGRDGSERHGSLPSAEPEGTERDFLA